MLLPSLNPFNNFPRALRTMSLLFICYEVACLSGLLSCASCPLKETVTISFILQTGYPLHMPVSLTFPSSNSFHLLNSQSAVKVQISCASSKGLSLIHTVDLSDPPLFTAVYTLYLTVCLLIHNSHCAMSSKLMAMRQRPYHQSSLL